MNFGVLLWFLGIIFAGFSCFFLCFMLYLHYLHQCYAHLPGPPRSNFILGNLPDLWKYKKVTGRTFSEFVMEQRFKYGSIFVLTLFHRAVVYLADPNYVRQVFINNHKYLHKASFVYDKLGFVFGERGMGYGLVTNTNESSWRKRRQLMNPAFHQKCLKDFMSNFNNISSRFLVRMGKVADSGEHVSMVEEFSKVTLEAISQVSFNINTHAIEDPESPFPSAIRNYLRGVQEQFDFPLNSAFLGIFQFKLFQKGSHKVQIDATQFLRKFASDCIYSRQRDIAEGKNVPEDLLNNLIMSGNLTKEEIIDEFITIFIAGQETTANSLAFTLFEVLRNPHVEAKLLDEIKEVLGDREKVEFEDLAKLKYTGQVFEESLRKHPIAPTALSRILEREITVANYQIPKGSAVSSSNLFFAMDPETWKDPELFDPERFADPANIPNLSMIHFPFSVGSRNCIGQTFAKFESKVILAKLLQKFKFKLLPNQTDQMLGRMTMTPQDGVMCEVTKCVGQ